MARSLWIRELGAIWLMIAVGWLGSGSVPGAQVRVPADQPTIQQGIAAATNGDTVLVAPGTYDEAINFLGKDIVLASAGGPGVTVIDAHQTNRVVTIVGSMGRSTRFEGFTVRNGSGGIYVSGAAPTICGNLVISNTGCSGIGMDLEFCSALVVSNVIAGNYSSGCSGGYGGGMLVGGAGAVEVVHNIITNNNPGGIEVFAAGAPILRENLIGWNTGSLTSWGGIQLVNHSDALIENNLIIGNIGVGLMINVPSGYRGPYVLNNTIAVNQAATVSGIYSDGFDAGSLVANNIVVAYGSQTAMQVGNFDASTPIMRYNDFYSAAGAPYAGIGPSPIGLNGNVSLDPLFLDPAYSDYRLRAASPLIDAGSNADAPTNDIDLVSRPFDGNRDGISQADLGAYEWIPHPPLAPRTLSGISIAMHTFLSWRASPEATGYNLLRAATSGGPYEVLQSLADTNFVDSSVVSNVVYYYTVNATNVFGQSPNSVEIAVRAGNLPPFAVNDSVTTPEDVPTNILVLANDSDPNNDPLSIVSCTQPSSGRVATNGLALLYTPATNFNGASSFTYVVTDGRLGYATGQVSVVVTPVNDPPMASNILVALYANSPGTPVTFAAWDPEGDPFTFIFVSPPAKGIFDANTWLYRPAHGYTGLDAMTYGATDGLATGNVATVTFFVRSLADTNKDGIPDSWASFYGITSRDADDDGDGFTNYQEYYAGTNPKDSGSFLRFTSILIDSNGWPHMTWDSVGGVRYRVLHRDGLGGAFTGLVRPVAEEMDPAPESVPSSLSYTDTNSPLFPGMRFYRVMTVTQ